MWTQRDQIQAYQFLRRRLVSALVAADANHPVSPSRRLVLGTVLGLVAALIVTAAYGITGFLHPSAGTDWKKPGQVVIEKETGTRFVLAGDGLLHPVLNFASARLLAGGDGSRTSTVAAKTLAEMGRGAPLGIAGAPDSIPAAARVTAGPLTACSTVAPDQPAATAPTTVLRWADPVAGRTLAGTQALLVTDGSGSALVSGGVRFRIPGAAQAAALGLSAQPATRVSAAWLSAVPAGADLDFLAVTGAGGPGPRIGGSSVRIGSVLSVTTALSKAPDQFYLVLSQGIAPVTAVQAQLALAGPGSPARRPVDVTATQLVGVAQASLPGRLSAASGATVLTDLPDVVRPASVNSPICLRMTAGARTAVFVADPAADLSAGVAEKPGRLTADRIDVPATTGALVSDRGDGAATTTYLVTDDGVKYPLPSADAQNALGLGNLAPVVLTSAALALLPTGPVLDPVAARAVAR